MTNKTAIEWTDNRWNPITGCTHQSPGCDNCYAETMAIRFWKGRKFSDIRFHPDRLPQIIKRQKLTKKQKHGLWFVNTMSDMFHGKVQMDWLHQCFAAMLLAQYDEFQILTKRAKRMQDFMNDESHHKPIRNYMEQWSNAEMAEHRFQWPPPNISLGVTVETQREADKRIPILKETRASLRYLSIEPMLEFISFSEHLLDVVWYTFGDDTFSDLDPTTSLHWAIIGGESGVGVRPFDLEWGISALEEFQTFDIPVFVKQMGSNPWYKGQKLKVTGKGTDMNEWPDERLKVRQMPYRFEKLKAAA